MVPICVYLFSAGPRSKPCLVHSPIGPTGLRCSDCHQVWWRKLLTSLKLSLSIGARGSSKTSKSPEVSSRSSRPLVHEFMFISSSAQSPRVPTNYLAVRHFFLFPEHFFHSATGLFGHCVDTTF